MLICTHLDLHHPLRQPSCDTGSENDADCEATVTNINKDKSYTGPAISYVSDNNHFLFSPPRVTFVASTPFSSVTGPQYCLWSLAGCNWRFISSGANTYAPSLALSPYYSFRLLHFLPSCLICAALSRNAVCELLYTSFVCHFRCLFGWCEHEEKHCGKDCCCLPLFPALFCSFGFFR